MAQVIIKNKGADSTPIQSAPAAKAPATALLSAPLNTGDEALDLLGDPNKFIVHAEEITLGDKTLLFFIRQLPFTEATRVDALKYRSNRSGQIVRDVASEEINGTAAALFNCVVKNTGNEQEPVWVPRWTMEQIIGKPEKRLGDFFEPGVKGLLDNASDEAQSLINELLKVVWKHNGQLNPLLQAQAMKSLGM